MAPVEFRPTATDALDELPWRRVNWLGETVTEKFAKDATTRRTLTDEEIAPLDALKLIE